MRIILFSLFLLSVVSLVPNCAYEANNKCLSCYFGFELASGRCDKCSNGFVMMNEVCISQGIYQQQQALQQQLAGSSTSSNPNPLQQSQNILAPSAGAASVPQTQTVQGVQAPNTIQNAPQSANNPVQAGSSLSSTMPTFEVGNTGVMYLLKLFGLASKIPSSCVTFTPEFKCLRCENGFTLANSICVSQIPSPTAKSITGPTPNSGIVGTDSNINSQSKAPSSLNPGPTFNSGSSSVLNFGSLPVSQGSPSASSGPVFNSGANFSSFGSQSSTSVQNNDSNCQTSNADGSCSQCYFRYFYSSQTRKCVIVNPQCATWSRFGSCLSCYQGYRLSGTECLIDWQSSGNSQSSSLGQSGTQPSSLAQSSGQSPQSSTQIIQPSTMSSSESSGSPSNSNGVMTGSVMGSDPNCRTANSDGTCFQCYNSFYYDAINARRCVSVSPLCKSWNNLGNCLSCYQGYNLFNNNCIMDSSYQSSANVGANDLPLSNQDPYCNTYKDGICAKCATRTYFDTVSKKCLQVDANCRSWTQSGVCTRCYDGFYTFNQRECRLIYPEVNTVQMKSSLNLDVNCRASDAIGVCTQCIWRFVLSPLKVCIKVSDLCKKWNETNALCTECYGGYSLTSNGQCRVSF